MTGATAAGAGGRLRVGIVGCGGIANSHARAYVAHPRVDLVGVVDEIPDRAAALRPGVRDDRVRLDRASWPTRQPDLVSVATPPGSHVEPTLELLDRGRSVLLEKPPTANLADLDALIAADSGERRVVVRRVPAPARIRRPAGPPAADLRRLGRPQVAVCETLWYRPDSYFLPDWRGNWAGEGGGPTLGHGIHQIDLLLHLLGPWRLGARRAVATRPAGRVRGRLAGHRHLRQRRRRLRRRPACSHRESSAGSASTPPAGTLEVNHVYGYRDADWSWCPAPDATAAATNGRDPGASAERRRRTSRGRRVECLGRRRRALQPRRPDQPAGRRPAGRPTARDDAGQHPARRWSSSPRCTPPR